MELTGAALRHKADLSARGTSIFGGIICRQDLDFLHGIYVQRSQHGTGRPGACGHCAIHHHHIFVGTAAVDIESTIRNGIRVKRIHASTTHTWLQQSQINWVATIQGEILNLFRFHHSSNLRRFRLHLRCGRPHFYGFCNLSHGEFCINVHFARGVQNNACLNESLKALRFDGNVVGANLQQRC